MSGKDLVLELFTKMLSANQNAGKLRHKTEIFKNL